MLRLQILSAVQTYDANCNLSEMSTACFWSWTDEHCLAVELYRQGASIEGRLKLPPRPWRYSRKLLWPVQCAAKYQAADEARRQEGQRRRQGCCGGAQQQHPRPGAGQAGCKARQEGGDAGALPLPPPCMRAVWSEGKVPTSESFQSHSPHFSLNGNVRKK